MKKLISAILCAILLLCAILPTCAETAAAETARPSANGRLRVEGTQLTDTAGQAVQLRGVSTHGLIWYPAMVSENLFRQVAEDWNGNLVRLAMYSEQYCENEKLKNSSLELVRKGIDAAIAADMYVLVDWHIMEDSDPNEHKEEAKAFFDLIASEYKDSPNLIFEICNEPNGDTTWADVRKYAEEVIPVIRSHIENLDNRGHFSSEPAGSDQHYFLRHDPVLPRVTSARR